jgi:hypothetical protein
MDDSEIKLSPDLELEEVICRCHRLLVDFRQQYLAVHPRRIGDPPFPIRGHDVIHRAIDYGIETCEAVRHFNGVRQPWFGAIVTRTYLEMILRMLWCCTRPNGWQEIIGWWAEDTIKAADRHLKDLGTDPLDLFSRQSLGSFEQAAPKHKPDLVSMLQEISRKQTSEQAKKNIEETYALFFKGALHPAAHANLVFLSLSWSGTDELTVGRSLVRASSWLINTSNSYLGWTPQKTVEYINSFIR